MIFIVVEKKQGIGYTEVLQCSEEIDAQRMVDQLYLEAKERNEQREFKYISIPGKLELPEEKPRQSKEERIGEKLSKIFKV
jgi:hypothetical protein